MGWLAFLGAAAFAAPVAPAPEPSATVSDGLGGVARLRLRQMYLKGAPEAALTIPDGISSVSLGVEIGRTVVRTGAYYSFVKGKIQAWISYAVPLFADGTALQFAGSDVIGLGPLYESQRFLERARSVPIGIGRTFSFGAVLLDVQRTAWRLASFDDPGGGEAGRIDSWGVEYHADPLIPDIAEILRQERSVEERSTLRYRRAFRGLTGAYRFDRADADFRWVVRGARARDEIGLRWFYGQSWDASPSLPIRETYGLGGAGALKGFGFEEFRGPGVVLGGVEYAFWLPWTGAWLRDWRVALRRLDLLAFAEAGRIQDLPWRGLTPVKRSAGLGFRLQASAFSAANSVLRLYAAQALESPRPRPVFYVVAGVSR